MKKITNWDRLSQMRPTDTTKYRDVYEAQQLERTHLQPKQSMKSRIIADVAMTIFFAFAFYFIWSMLRGWQLFLTSETSFAQLSTLGAAIGYCLGHPSLWSFSQFSLDTDLPEGCPFSPRCKYCKEICKTRAPKQTALSDTHMVSCLAYEEGTGVTLEVEKNG